MPGLIISPSEAAADLADHDPFARAKHGRYYERGVLYHTISQTRGNLFLLRPDLEGVLRQILAGVLAKAKGNWPNVSNFGTGCLSNHMHNCLAAMSGDPWNISAYLAFVKGELTRRWRHYVGWSGSIWDGFECTAVITAPSQIKVLSYVISQGAKENLVEDPRQWPGFHCAESLVTGEPIEGFWFNGTRYGKATHAEKVKKNPRKIDRADYYEPMSFSFDKLPALEHLSDDEYRGAMLEIVEEVVAERKRTYDAPALGVEAVCSMDPMTSRPVPTPPWFEKRKRMVVWDNRRAPEVKEYLGRYWGHQVQYRKAARAWRVQKVAATVPFPEHCFVPGFRHRPIAHMEQGTG